MKLKVALVSSVSLRNKCIGLLVFSSVVMSGCGGSSTTVEQPDIGAAQEQTGGENPTVEPENPTDTSSGTDTENPDMNLDEAVALSGSVASYPDSSTESDAGLSDAGLFLDDEETNPSTLTRADMRPVQALVSLFLLSDVDFQTPVATVKSNVSGEYTVTASDVREYLLQQSLITSESTEEEIITVFRTLGRLQVRAVIVRERNGVRKAMAIQSIADPADIDETGTPVPVAIDPIVHRVVKIIVDSIRDSVDSLESMGLAPAVVDQLISSVVEQVVAQIDQVLEETANEVIEIPEGLTIDEVIDDQETELELNVAQQQLDQLAGVLDGSDVQPENESLEELETTVAAADEVVEREQSTLESSLNSESQGLLSGFENALSSQLNGSVEEKITQAQAAGTEEALAEVFGERTEGVELEQALAAVEVEQKKQLRLSIRRFFLSLGLGVVVDENQSGDAGVVAIRMPLPYHLDADTLPGTAGLGEREIRLFKVGSGELDPDSDYTSDPFALLGVVGEDGIPMPPLKFVPSLGDVTVNALQSLESDLAQQAVDQAYERVISGALATVEDFELLDRVEVLHELRERLHDTTLVSSRVIDALVESSDRAIPLKRIAATIARDFEWIQEDVNLTSDGFPIYSGRRVPLASGANAVDSSELVRALSISLGESPVSTARLLTERNSFLVQFAPRAIEMALQRVSFDDQTDLIQTLLEIYPQEPAGYLDLITGAVTGEAEPEYERARDRLARGLTAALPASLYGQTLTSDSEVNIRSALFFLDVALSSEYLIDPNRGFYRKFEFNRLNGTKEVRYLPDYSNIKTLEPIGEVSVAAMMSELLNITAIDNGTLYDVALNELYESMADIPSTPQYEEYNADAFLEELGPRSESVNLECAVEMFDGSDPEAGEDYQKLNLTVFDVDYIESTGEWRKGDRIDADITSQLVEDETGIRRIYRVDGLSALREENFGRDYILRFSIDGYQNELPELFVFADGFVPELNLCDLEAPLYIGPDQAFTHIPGIALVSDQARVNYVSGTDADGVVIDANIIDPSVSEEQFEWVDLSNFEVPGASLYLTQIEESRGEGAGDFRLKSESNGFSLTGPDNSNVGFARLYGEYIDGELHLSLQQTNDNFPLFGLQSALGANARELISSIASEGIKLSDSLFVDSNNIEVAVAAGNFEPESLYLFRDRDGKFWALELRYFENYVDFDNQQKAVIDLGIANINSIGFIDVPQLAYDTVVPEDIGEFELGGFEYHTLYYGDWLVLERPTEYEGSELLPPEVLAFEPSADYNMLSQAIDGVFVRYAGDHFAENVTNLDDLDTQFGTPPDFSSVPVRLDAGRDGISFVKLAFDKNEKRYVMDPLPQDAARFVTQLNHNDLVAIFDDKSSSDGPVYLARVIRDTADAAANGYIGLEVLRYDSISTNLDDFDERQVVCFLEDRGACPEFLPELYSSTDATNTIGSVYDKDVDGVPALFDPNDHDPYIPGFSAGGDGQFDVDGSNEAEILQIDNVVGVNDDGSPVRALMLSTRAVYPGDIKSITLKSELFGADVTEQMVLSCTPPVEADFGYFNPISCTTPQVAGDIELQIFQQSEFGVSMLMFSQSQDLDAQGDYVEFSYKVNYHEPLGADGLPLVCGSEECPGRPDSAGVIVVPVYNDLPVQEQVTVQTEGQEPMNLLGLRELNVDREIRVSAAALPGAVEYLLTIYCPTSSESIEFGAPDFYLPEETLQFYAPARDELGAEVPPHFKVDVPWLAGRECRVGLRGLIQTEGGESAGISLYVQGGVKMVGAPGTGEYIDNEMALNAGDSVCIVQDSRLSADDCAASNTLFGVQSIDVYSQNRGQVTLELSDDVLNAHAYGQVEELLQTKLEAGAQIYFDGFVDGSRATCGEVIAPTETITSCDVENDSLQSVFAVSADGMHLQSLLEGVSIEGPVNSNGSISLDEPGYYKVVLLSESLETGTVFNDYVELLDIMIDVWNDADGVREVYARFERPGSQNSLADEGQVRVLQADVPGHLHIQSAQGHEINIDTRAIVGDQLKLSFSVYKPLQLSGSHDLNADGVADIEVFMESGLWFFRFDPSVDNVRMMGISEDQEIPLDSAGYRLATVEANQGFVEFFVQTGEIEYLVVAEFNSDGFGQLQVVDQYPIEDTSMQPLFDGVDVNEFFPVELSSASPFSRDVIEPGYSVGIAEENIDEFFDDFTDEFVESETVIPVVEKLSGFRVDSERLTGILEGRYKTGNLFTTDHLRDASNDASCFGPSLFYQNHPDGPDAEPTTDFSIDANNPYASLPAGDLGIWKEYDDMTGDACAAAQMNSQLTSARRRSFAGLVTLATVARRLSVEQQAEVISGAEVSVVDRMNALSLSDIYFERANISRDVDTGEWFYQVKLIEHSPDGTDGKQTRIEMNFHPGSEANRWDYSGVIRFRIEDYIDAASCADESVEHLSSLSFERDSQDLLKTEYRYGLFCGHDGDRGFDSEGSVDPAYASVGAADGWFRNFTIFTANLNPENGAGSYAYSWQAGVNDSHSRVLNVGLNDFEPVDGEAWYGYGASLTGGVEVAGEINGFICNWAGPGNDHTLLERAQRQSLIFDSASDLFVVPEGGSDITYAPTVACTYNSDAGGSFLYDRNLDGTLADESAESVDVGPGEIQPFDLAPPESSNYFGMDIEQVIMLRGFVKPESPSVMR